MSDQPNVRNITAQNSKGETVRFTVSTDLVDYMDSARTFGRADLADPKAHGRFQRRVIAIPDQAGEAVVPMMLSIGSDNGFHLVRRGSAAAGDGWTLTNLGAAFDKVLGKRARVRAFDAAWAGDGRIAVAVAVDSGSPGEASRLFVACDLTAKSDWGALRWTDCGVRPGVQVTGIRVLDCGDRSWRIAVTADTGRLDTLFLLRGSDKSFAKAPIFSPAVDYQEVFDFEAAADPILGAGIALLGQSGGVRVLSFRPFPPFNADGTLGSSTPAVPLPCPEGANSLEAGLTVDEGTDLYIGGQGVHRIEADEFYNQDEAQVELVMAPQAAANVLQIAVADKGDGNVSVWAVLQNGHLVTVRRPAGKDWGTPLRLRKDVQEIAPVRGDRHAFSSLLVVYTDGSAGFLLLDAQTGAWRERPLLVANPNEVSRVTCYGTALRVLDKDRGPIPLTKVRVSASVLTSVILNNRNVLIGPQAPLEVETDANGCVCLYDRARSLTPSVYRFEVDGVAGAFDVNPAGGAQERFSNITADQLLKATVPDGKGGSKPLLPAEFRDASKRAQVNGVAAALKQSGSLAMKTTTGALVGIDQRKAGAAFSSRIQSGRLQRDYVWGIRAGASGVTAASPQQINAVLSAGRSVEDFFVDLGDSLADFFEGLWERVKEGWTFVVRTVGQAVEFICELGGKIKKFVLDTLEEIGTFFSWLWEQIKTGLEEVFDFLKFVFDWNDILLARNVLVDATGEALKHVKESMGTMKDAARQGFDSAIAEIRRWQTEIGVVPAELPPPAPGESLADRFKQITGPIEDLVDQAMGNSVFGWVMDRLNGAFDEIVQIESHPADAALKAATNFLEGVAQDQFADLEETWNQIQADVRKVVGDSPPGNSQLSFETIRKLFVAVGADAVVGLLKMLRDLVSRMLDLMHDVLDAIIALMFAKIRFPFIEKLVQLISPETKVDTSFRMIDAFMLLVAVPATITYKLIFKEAPFKQGEEVALPFGRVRVQQGFDFLKFALGFGGVAAALLKFLKGIWGFAWALKDDVKTSPAVLAAVVFGYAGLAAQLFTRHQNEGETVSTLQWAAIAVGSAALVPTGCLAILKVASPIDKTIPMPHKVDAVIELVGAVGQIALGAVVFGLVLDRLKGSTEQIDRDRKLPETLGWSGDLYDQAGTIMADAATLLPMAAIKLKAILLGFSMGVKGAALGFRIGSTVSNKKVMASLNL